MVNFLLVPLWTIYPISTILVTKWDWIRLNWNTSLSREKTEGPKDWKFRDRDNPIHNRQREREREMLSTCALGLHIRRYNGKLHPLHADEWWMNELRKIPLGSISPLAYQWFEAQTSVRSDLRVPHLLVQVMLLPAGLSQSLSRSAKPKWAI